MNDDRWIVIPNWGRFQHYKDRNPTWIKVYTELSSTPEWFELSWARRGILVSIWIEYARSRCRLRVDQVRHLGATWLRPGDLRALNDAGFIEFSASAPSRERARERGTSYPKERGAPNTANGAAPLEEKNLPADPDPVGHARELMRQVFDK